MIEPSSISVELRRLIDGFEQQTLSREEYLRVRRELIARWCNEPLEVGRGDITFPLPVVTASRLGASDAPTLPPRLSNQVEPASESADTLLAFLGKAEQNVTSQGWTLKWSRNYKFWGVLGALIILLALVAVVTANRWMSFWW